MPARALEHVNRIVLERKQHDIFVTGIYLTLDVTTNEVTLANAGHLPPLHPPARRAAELERVEGGSGTAIGIFDDASLRADDAARSSRATRWSCAPTACSRRPTRRRAVRLRAARGVAGGGLVAADVTVADWLQRDLREHVGEAPQYDDVTLIVLGVTRGGARARSRRDEPTQQLKKK